MIKEKKAEIKGKKESDLCEQFYHESSRIWSVLKKKGTNQIVEFIPISETRSLPERAQ